MLIADDHAEVAKAVSRLLALECDVVGSVGDGSAVLEAAQRLRPDVVVLDLNLPNVNGLEACRQITVANPATKVIVFTAMNDPDIRQRSFEVGASAFVSRWRATATCCRPSSACVPMEAMNCPVKPMGYHAAALALRSQPWQDRPDAERFLQILGLRSWRVALSSAGARSKPRGLPPDAHPHVQQILLLQGVDRGNLVVDSFTANFRVDLDKRVGRPVNVVQVVVLPTGFVGAPEQAVVDYIRATFANRPDPDLIVTVAGPAATFARKHRQELFPDSPLVFASVDQRVLGDVPLGKNETAVAVVNDFPHADRRHPAGASPDQAGVRGDGSRTDWAILAS